MTQRIAGTCFTWNPDQESRADAWRRIKAHVHGELDRIYRDEILQRGLDRRRARPQHARDLEMAQAVRVGRATPETLARTHGLSQLRVREILRREALWEGRLRHWTQTSSVRPPPPMATPLEQLPDSVGGLGRTTMVFRDP